MKNNAPTTSPSKTLREAIEKARARSGHHGALKEVELIRHGVQPPKITPPTPVLHPAVRRSSLKVPSKPPVRSFHEVDQPEIEPIRDEDGGFVRKEINEGQ